MCGESGRLEPLSPASAIVDDSSTKDLKADGGESPCGVEGGIFGFNSSR